MRFTDEGIVLDVKKILENRFSIKIFTKNYGYIQGITHKKVDIGQHIFFDYSSKNEHGAGFVKINKKIILIFSFELSPFVASVCHLLSRFLPENHPYPDFYTIVFELLSGKLEQSKGFYIWFEEMLLQHLGFGLSLTKCAVTDTTQDLIYVSPKTGCSVSKDVGLPYHASLIFLPQFMSKKTYIDLDASDFNLGLNLTGYFIKKHLGALPKVRQMLN
ncbi:MAG: DNA repair protein RecO [Alphaproteobacteria bacterium]|nr:MAG: DNA repair protein RecO [Alphaproteobacteria bacterium]